MRLYRLGAEARHLVTPELARGTLARLPRAAYERFLEEPEEPVELDELDDALDRLVADEPRHDAGLDLRAAPAIHRALPVSRREASHPGIWRYLAVAHRPDFVRHRWLDQSWATTRARYWSPGTRHDSNAFSRLWWIAELTREGGSYALTAQVLASQSLATQLFVRQFATHRPAVEAFVRVLGGGQAGGPEIERVARELNGRLSTLVLEAMATEELELLIRELAAAR